MRLFNYTVGLGDIENSPLQVLQQRTSQLLLIWLANSIGPELVNMN